mmetsp:Transcript_21532/g.20687  ORF Transcript_21532/g.20687 Transcript_21532/m.20687 type:complete len:82 (+) Transcript_21532:709-954(+)
MINLMTTQDDLKKATLEVFYLIPLNIFIYSTGVVFIGTIRGLGKFTLGTIILFINGYVIGIPLTYLLAFYYSLDIAGLWYS